MCHLEVQAEGGTLLSCSYCILKPPQFSPCVCLQGHKGVRGPLGPPGPKGEKVGVVSLHSN